METERDKLVEKIETGEGWQSYLERQMEFPFEGIIIAPEPEEVIKKGELFDVLGIHSAYANNGFMMKCSFRGKNLYHPLCGIDVKSRKKNKKTSKAIDLYIDYGWVDYE